MPSQSRRAFLTLVSALAGGFAGCQTSSDATPADSTMSTSTRTDTPSTTSPADTSTETPTETETPTAHELGGNPGRLPEKAWPSPHRGASNGAYLPDGPLFERKPVVDWQVVPTVPSDQDRYYPKFSKPVIADGRLYTVNSLGFSTMVERPDQQFLRAYDTTTGDERWEYTIQHGGSAYLPTRPAVGDGVVLVGHDERLRAVGIAEGNEVWRRNLGEPVHAVYPAVDRTYVRAHRSVVAVDGKGTRAWTKRFKEFPGTLARGDRNLYVAVSRRFLALDPATGDVRWRQTLPAVEGGYGVRSLVTVDGGVFALQNSGDLYAFNDSGKQVWSGNDRYESLATDGSRLYAGTEGTLRALAVATGKRVWELRCEDVAGCDSASSFGKPVVTDRVLYSSLDSGRLVAVRPDDGTVFWSLDEVTNFEHITLGTDAIYGVGDEFEPLVRLRPSEHRRHL